METIAEILTPDIRSVVIAGHVNPDGDCVGSCMALALYVKKNYPKISVTVCLEELRDALQEITGGWPVISDPDEAERLEEPDLFVLLDASSFDRIGVAKELFKRCSRTVCIDHHLTNDGLCRVNHIFPEVGSCCEVLYELLDKEALDRDIARELYTGIIHDTGVFQYSNTRPRTHEIAAELIAYGFDFSRIIYDTSRSRSFAEARFLGYCLNKSLLFAGGRVVVSSATADEMRTYGMKLSDVGEVVTQLRLTQGTDAAVFVYETGEGLCKVSLRSGPNSDVDRAAAALGGGGHKKAAGCTVSGKPESVIKTVVAELAKDLDEA